MKKLILLSIVFVCYSSIFAATEIKLFTGDTTPSLFSRMDMIAWIDATAYFNFGTTAAPAYTQISNNPDKTGINATDKALHLTSLKGHSWWGDFLQFTLASPITLTANTRYLHMYQYRENMTSGFNVSINALVPVADALVGTQRFDTQIPAAGKWCDMVMDLKWFVDNNVPLSSLCILMDRNWNANYEPVTNYYFDEIVLNDSILPRGINVLPDTKMSLFYGNSPSYTKWVKTLDLQNAENKDSIIANPFTTQMAVLNSPKVLKFDKSANASWWQGVRTILPGLFQVNNGSEYYLHVMVNIPTMDPNQDPYVVQLNAFGLSGNQLDSGDALKYWSTDAGNWVDMVLDVTSLGYIQEFSVRFDVRWDAKDANINSPAGTFYMDAVSIDNNPDQRTVVAAPTAVITPKTSDLRIYSANRNIVVEGNVASVEVFNLLGKTLSNISTTTSKTLIPVNQSGVYLVKTVSTNGNLTNSKVIIK